MLRGDRRAAGGAGRTCSTGGSRRRTSAWGRRSTWRAISRGRNRLRRCRRGTTGSRRGRASSRACRWRPDGSIRGLLRALGGDMNFRTKTHTWCENSYEFSEEHGDDRDGRDFRGRPARRVAERGAPDPDGREGGADRHAVGRRVPRIEVASFVSPKWVPQMADSAEVWPGSPARPACATPRSPPT
jgi:hypothetical protein